MAVHTEAETDASHGADSGEVVVTGVPKVDETITMVNGLESASSSEAAEILDTVLERLEQVLSDSPDEAYPAS